MQHKEYRLAAVMFSDIVGFSQMMERDESGTLDLLATHNRIVRSTVDAHGGRVIKTVGDAFLCEFPNTVNAVKSAVEIQEAVGIHNSDDPDLPLHVRIGVHLGDIYFLEDDAVGDGVNVVTRLQSVAQPGRICISQDVYHLVTNKLPYTMTHLGKVKLRDISREIGAYEISVSRDAESAAVPGTAGTSDPRSQSGAGSDAGTDRADSGSRGPREALRANLQSPEYADFNELKALVLQEIKRAGRRISVDEVRSRLPRRGAGVDRALDALADKGFLTRVRRDGGSVDYAPMNRGVEVNTPGGRTFYDEDGNRIAREEHAEQRRRDRERTRERRRDDWPTKWDEKEWRGDDKEHQREQSGWDRALQEPPPASGYDPLVEDYKDHAANVAEKEKAGFRSHLISYLGVNAGLFFIWAMTMFGGFPWFLIPLLAWGIGIASHFSGVRDRVQESRELDRSEGLTREQLRIYRKFVKNRSAWRGHFVSNVATSVFLVMLNLITSPGFMWSVFPVAFMGIGLLSHLPAYKSRERRLVKRLRDLGARIGGVLGGTGAVSRDTGGARTQPADGPGAQAEQIRQRLLSSINAMPSGSPLGEDFEPVLDNYVDQIRLLDRKNSELDEIMRGIPLADLERDLATLQERRNETQSEKVLAEYDRSITQIQKQQSSYAELKNEREILRLRLASSLNQLKQLEIDVARMKSMSSDEEAASVAMLRDKSSELSRYLDDLRAGYDELE
ncbi:MAG: 2TM domain-containing protein [Spirochaetota bacterium]